MIRIRSVFALVAVALAFTFVISEADARVGGGFSGGSRGSRTFSAPPATQTAPNAAQPIQRSTTQPNATQPGPLGGAATAGGAFSRPGGLFGGGMLGGLAAGFLGAGLFGMLFGHGLFGGMGGLSSFLGLALQVVLVVMVARLLFAWWQRRSSPAFAGPASRVTNPFDNLRAGFGANTPSPPASETITLEKSDFDAFERLLGDIQAAYSAEDVGKLRALVTPEMLSYFAEDLANNASRGEINRVENVKLLQGDLAEAWHEGTVDYATVDMRFSLDDTIVDRASGRVLSGGPDQATEAWTFMRSRGGGWLLSAIQQA